MTIVTERAEIEARAKVTDRMRPLRVDGRVVHQIGAAVALGLQRARHPATPPTTSSRCPATRTSRSRSPRRSPATCAPGRAHGADDRAAGRRRARRATASRPNEDDPLPRTRRRPRDRAPAPATEIAIHRAGRAADGLLHRHDGVHRLQGLRGRLQAVERPARRRLAVPARAAPTTTPASCRPRRWRHVRFVELFEPSPLRRRRSARSRPARRRCRRSRPPAHRPRRCAQRTASSTSPRRCARWATGSSCPTSASTARTPAASTPARPAR